ncbi:Nicotinamidase-related amidase [Arboricoccus pini]|uniref:Nicotinamidase-related amidase n=1 Tax=Arboricoccus pini TaxID=1963835 RepID=A0A212RIZ2_9PROT|nr:isochorismatase family cysteine hydrolase [Arboricoccus pini]SNB72398.1 Nicotinamidase-related amidase [Arboricoccus pini]
MTPPWVPPDSVHLCVDMQRLFAAPLGWRVATIEQLLPPIVTLGRLLPGRSIALRFAVPPTAETTRGGWRHYYASWPQFLGQNLDPALLDLLPGLEFLTDIMIDKMSFGGFEGTDLVPRLKRLRATTLIISGVETDICVLSTVMSAIDKGYRVVIPTDAVASGDEAGHAAALKIFSRLPELVQLTTTARIAADLAS